MQLSLELVCTVSAPINILAQVSAKVLVYKYELITVIMNLLNNLGRSNVIKDILSQF